jgi:hypothetical protein
MLFDPEPPILTTLNETLMFKLSSLHHRRLRIN